MKRNYVNDVNITEAFYEALTYTDYKNNDTWTPSALNDPPHMNRLKRETKEIDIPVSQLVNVFSGSAVHRALEPLDTIISETRFFSKIEVDGVVYNISAKTDCYDHRNNSVEDFKFTSKYTVTNSNGDYVVKDNYVFQLNMNAYIIKKLGLPVDKLYLNAIIKDLTPGDNKKVRFKNVKTAKSIPVELWSIEKAEAKIKEKIRYQITFNGTECTDSERWKDETVYACKKEGATRARKIHKDYEAAQKDLKANEFIEERIGENKRCMNYCEVANVCEFYKNNVAKLNLQL